MKSFIYILVIVAAVNLKGINCVKNEPVDSPETLIKEETKIWHGISCRRGFGNMTDEFMEATYHCANVNYVAKTRRNFTEQTVEMDGETPVMCLRTCVIMNNGLVNSNMSGLNETAIRKMFNKQMTTSGGRESSYILAKQFMACDRKHPTTFQNGYRNCEDMKDLLECNMKVLADCTEDKDFEKYRAEYLQYKKTLKDGDDRK